MDEPPDNDNYGVKRMNMALEQKGIHVSPRTVYRTMSEMGIMHRRRTPRGITKATTEIQDRENLIKRDFKAEKPLQKLLSDITEIQCYDGKLYVSAVLDCYNGEILSVAMDGNMKKELCIRTVTELELQEQIETIKKALRHSLDLLSNGDIDSEEYKYLKHKKNTEIGEIEQDIEKLSANRNENEEIKAEMEKQLAELETIINLENEKIDEDVFRNIVEKIEVYNNHLLKFYLIGLSHPICLTYETKGKMETYEINFKIV